MYRNVTASSSTDQGVTTEVGAQVVLPVVFLTAAKKCRGLQYAEKAANRVAILVCADALRYSGVKDQLSKIGAGFRQESRTPKMLRLENWRRATDERPRGGVTGPLSGPIREGIDVLLSLVVLSSSPRLQRFYNSVCGAGKSLR
jgi:hypothetical protein